MNALRRGWNSICTGMGEAGSILGVVAIALLVVSPFLAWFTHLYVCFKGGLWGFLVAGAIFFPIGIVHGFGVWFGAW